MENKSKARWINFTKGNSRIFLILVFTLLNQYSILNGEESLKTFTPDPEIQVQIKHTVSILSELFEKPNTKEEMTNELNKFKEKVGKDIKKFLPEWLHYRANLRAKKSEMDTRTFEKNLIVSDVILGGFYYADILKSGFSDISNRVYSDISNREWLEAIVPYLGTKDPSWQEDLRDIFPMCLIDMGTFDMLKDEVEHDFSEVESYIKERKENLPLGLIKYMYEEAPKESALTLTRVYMPEDKTKVIETKITEAEKLVQGTLYAPLDERFSEGEKAANVLFALFQHNEWWVDLYVAEIIRQHQEFRSPRILIRLIDKNQHPLVRETMREMLEKLLQEVK